MPGDVSSSAADTRDDNLFISSVNEAIQQSLSQNKTLLIYLTDDTSESVAFGENFIIRNDHLRSLLQHFILLKLVKDTQEFEYFKQVFATRAIPSVYAIKTGSIKDVIFNEAGAQELTVENFNERIDALLRPAPPDLPAQNTPVPAAAAAPAAPAAPAPAPASSPNPRSSTARTKKDEEKKRRKYSSLKEESAELAAQKYREQLQKQAREAKDERERILRLLAADKAERAHRRRDSRHTEEQEADEIKENIRHDHNEDPEYSIQLKLFNGQSLRSNFQSTSTLSEVRHFINLKHPEYQSTPYYFYKPIERITYSDIDELNKTLKDLKLNRSLLIIKPSDHYGTSVDMTRPGGFQNLANQRSALGWIRSSVGGLVGYMFGSGIQDPASASSAPATSSSSMASPPPASVAELPLNNNNTAVHPDPLLFHESADASQYSTPVLRSSEPSRPSTPKPALMLSDSTNNFSILASNASSSNPLNDQFHHHRNTKDERIVYNGNDLSLEDDASSNSHNNSKNGNSLALGEGTS